VTSRTHDSGPLSEGHSQSSIPSIITSTAFYRRSQIHRLHHQHQTTRYRSRDTRRFISRTPSLFSSRTASRGALRTLPCSRQTTIETSCPVRFPPSFFDNQGRAGPKPPSNTHKSSRWRSHQFKIELPSSSLSWRRLNDVRPLRRWDRRGGHF
jgi:hypothetical protein